MQRAFGNAFRHLEHIPAVNGNTSARLFVHSDSQYGHLLKRNTASEMGCSLSHVRAIRRAAEYCERARCDMAVIMEDDVTSDLLPLWRMSLTEMVTSLPDNCTQTIVFAVS